MTHHELCALLYEALEGWAEALSDQEYPMYEPRIPEIYALLEKELNNEG